jgi:transcriptional regulator with XRE-family HTH domain/tetratricopeptide (TPR) repeat protein
MIDFGDELRRLLAERGISLSAAARQAGCSKGYLSNAANGRKPLTPRVAAGLDRLFGTGDTFAAYALLPPPGGGRPGNASPPHAAEVVSEVIPGTTLSDDALARPKAATRSVRGGSGRRAGGADGGDSAPERPEEKERLGYAFAHPASADLVTVAHLREQVRRLDKQYDRSPAATLIAETGQCLGQIGFLRAHARRADVRRELYAAEAETATLMGQLVWDASQRRDQATALAYYDQAAAAARNRGERAAEGLALLRTSMVALYGHKNPRAGLEACEHTADVAATASSVITGLAVLHAAEAHAMLGERQSCEQALVAADRQFAQISSDDPAIDLFSPAQPGRLAGSCYLFLGDARHAAPILEATASQLQYHSKAEAIVLGNLALAYIGQSRLDEAAAALDKAIDVIEVTWGGGGLNVVFSAARQLRRWQRVSVVREVCDRLLALMAAS